MRHALIIAGGSGTRLWPMSRAAMPKQLIPFIDGKSLLQIAVDRLDGLVPDGQTHICAGQQHRDVIIKSIDGMAADRFYGEPMGRDTLNAVGFAAAVIAEQDPDAVIAVFTADHIIEPVETFQQVVTEGFKVAEQQDNALVTFGISPTHPATGYGYLQLGAPIAGTHARVVDEFKEKPPLEVAEQYVAAGPLQYLWNSGMFVWKASTLLDAIKKFAPSNYQGLQHLGEAWSGPNRDAELERIYPTLDKISVDFAVMEPASKDDAFTVAALPMALRWLDVGSWPSFAQTRPTDDDGNALAAERRLLMDSRNCLVASDQPDHLIATIGCEDLLIVHTADATLVCRRDDAEKIKQLHKAIGEQFGDALL